MKKRICFCYSGEGARGSIQAGITKSLIEKGIVPDLTIGVSSGSICASSYSYLGAEGLVDLWNSIDNILDVFGLNWNFLWKNGFLNSKPLAQRVASIVHNHPVCESIVSKLNIETGEVRYVSNKTSSIQNFIDSVVASIAITTLVEDKNGWVDAGSRILTPINQAINRGATDIYVITGRPMELAYWPKPKGFLSLFKFGLRALDISLYELMIRDINDWIQDPEKIKHHNVNITLLQPNQFLFESTEFSKCKIGTEFGYHEYQSYNPIQMQELFSTFRTMNFIQHEI